MLRRWILPVLLILAAGFGGALAILGTRPPAPGPGGRARPPAPPPPPEAPAPPPADPPFGIVYGGGLGGRLWIPPCSKLRQGGLTWAVGGIRALAALAPSLVLDLGDSAAAPGDAGALELRAALGILSEAGLSAAAVGEGDLLPGLEAWRRVKNAPGQRAPILCANLRDEAGLPLAAPSALLPAGRRSVLVTAILSPSFEAGLREAGVPVRILPPAAAVREALRAGGKADFAILLSHAPLEESRALLREIPELDAVLSAHAGPSPLAKGEVHGGRVLLAPGDGWRHAGGAVFKEAEPGRRPTLLDQTFRAVGGGPGDVPPPTSPLLGETAYRLAEAGFLPGVLRKAAAAAPPGSPVLTGPGACGSCHPGAHAAWRSGTAHSRSMEKVREKAFGAVPDCLRCHATGAGFRGGHAEKGDAQDAVTCEACHGPGAAHAAADGKSALADAKASCAACHLPEMSPGFRFEEAWPRVVHGR